MGAPGSSDRWDVFRVIKPSSAIEMHADPEVIMQNGTTGTLRCTFKSSEVVSRSTSVTWSFQSSQPDNQFFKAPYVIFYFSNGKAFPGQDEYKDRLQFIGDIQKRDVSIQLSPARFSDIGTFFCDVKNPPDVTGNPAQTKLSVVPKDPTGWSPLSYVMLTLRIAGLILMIIITVLVIRITWNTKALHDDSNVKTDGDVQYENVEGRPADARLH